MKKKHISDPNNPTREQIMDINLNKAVKNWTVLELRRYVYRRWYYDDDFFINYFLWHYKVDKKTKESIADWEVHKQLRNLLSSWKDMLCVFPRNHAKTTNSFFIIVKDVCYKREDYIWLVAGESLWVEIISKVRDEFEENSKIKEVFWRLVPERSKREANKKWTRKNLDFLNEARIEALTLWGKIRWKRFTKIIVDDPQEGKDVRNVSTADQFIYWFFTTVYPVLDPSWNCVVLWTNVGELSFVNFLIKEKRGFEILEFAAVKDPEYKIFDDGKKHLVWWLPLRPSKRTIENLDKMLQTIWRKAFQQEYMNIPSTLTGELVFELPEWLEFPEFETDKRFAGLRIYKDPCQCSWGIDLSMWWRTWDFSTIVARDENWDLVFVYQWRVLRYELITIIDYLDELWYVWTKVFERNLGTAQAIFDMAQDKPWYVDIYQQKTIGKVNDTETLNFWRYTNRQNKEKMIAELQALLNWYVDEYGEERKITQFDKREYNEMKFYVFDDKGWMNAMQWHFDDLIIADALCCQWSKDMYGI